MDLGAGTARAGFTHHPEVVFLVSVDNVNGRIKSHTAKFLRPEIPRFLIPLGGVLLGLVGLVNGGINALRREFPHFDDQFPRPGDGFLLEIIAERPITQHFKKSVVIGIQPDVIQIVVFAASADAFLRVRRASRCVWAFRLAQKNGHKLIHAGVGE